MSCETYMKKYQHGAQINGTCCSQIKEFQVWGAMARFVIWMIQAIFECGNWEENFSGPISRWAILVFQMLQLTYHLNFNSLQVWWFSTPINIWTEHDCDFSCHDYLAYQHYHNKNHNGNRTGGLVILWLSFVGWSFILHFS